MLEIKFEAFAVCRLVGRKDSLLKGRSSGEELLKSCKVLLIDFNRGKVLEDGCWNSVDIDVLFGIENEGPVAYRKLRPKEMKDKRRNEAKERVEGEFEIRPFGAIDLV